MDDLTDNELRALAYYGIGVSSEGGDCAYQLSFAGKVAEGKAGLLTLKPTGNSGYSIGTLQTDLGQHPNDARRLIDAFQAWVSDKHNDWLLRADQYEQFVSALSRDGHHIRDPDYDTDITTYHKESKIPTSHFTEAGPDIDLAFKSHLNAYLAADEGKTYVHGTDIAQVDKLMKFVAMPLMSANFYQKANAEDRAKIFAITAKVYNQSEGFGRNILDQIHRGEINSLADINKRIDALPNYMHTGRNAALKGAETFNAFRAAGRKHSLHEAWLAVMAYPLIDPTQVGKDPKQPYFAEQYATVRAIFVDPDQGRAFIDALSKGTSCNYGDPSHFNSRGFYVEGSDFVQWDRDGQGRAFVDGQWSQFSRDELSLARNDDRTLDVKITRDGAIRSLLHVTHPTMYARSASHHQQHAHGHAQVVHEGMRGETVRHLQAQLGELDYLPNVRAPDGQFGAPTRVAVQAFQRDHHLAANGKVGPATQRAIDNDVKDFKNDAPSVAGAMSDESNLDDPRNAKSPHHRLFNELQRRFPDASENRLLQFTAACHSNDISMENLQSINFDRVNGVVHFGAPNDLIAKVASVDVKQPSPQPEQSVQQIQRYDQLQAHVHAQTQVQVAAQQQAHAQQGPMR